MRRALKSAEGPIPGTAVKTLVKPVANAIRILRLLGEVGRPVRASEVSRELSLNPSTCFNILRTLVHEGLVDFDETGKTYETGYGLQELVSRGLSGSKRLAAVRRLVHDFAVDHGVTATLWRRLGEDRMVLEMVEYSPDGLRVHMPSGQRLPILMGATGRAAAHRLGWTKPQIRAAFDRLRWSGTLEFEQFLGEADDAVARGWGVDDGYFSQGVVSLAAPILDAAGILTHSFVVVAIRDQLDADRRSVIGADMVPVAARLSSILNES
jgi:DNA-binding IclR family transcriptional regulator